MSFAPPRFRTPAVLFCLAPALVQGAIQAPAQDGELAERLFRSGERAYAAKSYKEALDTWNQLLQSVPRSEFAPRALLALARHQVEVERRPEAAMPFLDRIKAEHMRTPEAADGLLLRGSLLARQARRAADLKDAMAEFNRVLDLFPDSPAVPGAR
ncbi:MAG TPA: outer membrane protein assembly factor BamD, partial [Geothrix sp.]|nr:outer membrane protein assembly factor BamD [Geothrix sp.]